MDARAYAGRPALVTGAGGFIGTELALRLAALRASRLVLVDRDENTLHETGLRLREAGAAQVLDVVADIRDRGRMERLFASERPAIVFHAAAYKQVPMMEAHASEAVLNNAIATRDLLDLSADCEAFTLISTDKAVRPSSVMGATKRLAELLVQARARAGGAARRCCVRFGNVYGSPASFVPIARRQIAERREVTVTHPEARRFFMTVREAVTLVLRAGAVGRNGTILVLDMGEPVRITTLAQRLIREAGLEPGRDVRIRFVGLRPGEKIEEELAGDGESLIPTGIAGLSEVQGPPPPAAADLEAALARLEEAARRGEDGAVRELLRVLPLGYRPASLSPPAAARP